MNNQTATKQHAEIADLWRQEVSLEEIAARTGRTPGGVQALLQRLRRAGWDIPPTHKTEAVPPPEVRARRPIDWEAMSVAMHGTLAGVG